MATWAPSRFWGLMPLGTGHAAAAWRPRIIPMCTCTWMMTIQHHAVIPSSHKTDRSSCLFLSSPCVCITAISDTLRWRSIITHLRVIGQPARRETSALHPPSYAKHSSPRAPNFVSSSGAVRSSLLPVQGLTFCRSGAESGLFREFPSGLLPPTSSQRTKGPGS